MGAELEAAPAVAALELTLGVAQLEAADGEARTLGDLGAAHRRALEQHPVAAAQVLDSQQAAGKTLNLGVLPRDLRVGQSEVCALAAQNVAPPHRER